VNLENKYEFLLISLTLRERHTRRLFENRVLRRAFRLKGNEVGGDWRKLLMEELHSFFTLAHLIIRLRLR
jgi:hypothetical protein